MVGGKALMARPFREELFLCGFPYQRSVNPCTLGNSLRTETNILAKYSAHIPSDTFVVCHTVSLKWKWVWWKVQRMRFVKSDLGKGNPYHLRPFFWFFIENPLHRNYKNLPKMKTSNISIFSKFNKEVTSRNYRKIHRSKTFLKQNVLKIADFLMKTILKHFLKVNFADFKWKI